MYVVVHSESLFSTLKWAKKSPYNLKYYYKARAFKAHITTHIKYMFKNTPKV